MRNDERFKEFHLVIRGDKIAGALSVFMCKSCGVLVAEDFAENHRCGK